MTESPELLGTYQIPSPQSGELTLPVRVYRRIGLAQLTDFEENWRPQLDAARADIWLQCHMKPPPPEQHFLNLAGKAGIQDSHWDWRTLILSASAKTYKESFFITHEESLQAMMLVDLSHRCRLSEQKDNHLVYAEYIAVAPWCRRTLKNPPFLVGLGTLLLATTVSLSIDEGYGGRIGLHSLPQSEGFYERKHMTSIGRDKEYSSLMYYEFTSANARVFLDSD